MSEIPEWFSGCWLNYAENLLKHPDDSKVAFITCGEKYNWPREGELHSDHE